MQHRKKYMTKNVREVSQLNGNLLIQALSSSLNVQTSRFLASVVRNSRHEARGQEVQRGPKSYKFLHLLFPLPSR